VNRQSEQLLYCFSEENTLEQWLVGCDADIGGYSSAKLTRSPEGYGVFHGELSLKLPENRPDIVKSGYAAIKTRDPPTTLFGAQYWDTSLFRYLCAHVRGDRRHYFVNVQTGGLVQTDLFQHRLHLRRTGKWEKVLIAWRDFTLTNNGEIMPEQMEMFRERVRSVGFSVADRVAGPFRLEIDWIKMVNTEDTDGDMDLY